MKKLAIGAAALVGGGAAFLNSGRGKGVRDRVTGLFQGGGKRVSGAGQSVASTAQAVTAKATHLREQPKEFDDVTLARKVESEIFRDADAPKGTVDVNVQEGVIQLRGEVERPELIEELVAKARKVQGVEEVENLLHVPGTPAPMHQ